MDKKHHKISYTIEPQIKTVSRWKDASKKTVYLLLFQLSFLQSLASSKDYISVFPSFISGLSEVGFLMQVYERFGKTRTSVFFQTNISVLVKRKYVYWPLCRDIGKKHHDL